MKKIIIFFIFIAVLFGINGCRRNRNTANNDKINVITTIFASYDFVRQIAGDKVNLTMLLPPGAESHSFEPSPRDIINIQNSDVFVYIGGESDRWVDHILQSMNTENMNILSLLETVEILEEEIIEGMEGFHDHDHDDDLDDDGHEHDEIEYDEHVWTSPRNAILIVNAITDLLSKADPANADYFKQNAAAYIVQLQDLDKTFKDIAGGAKRKTLVFGDRFPFRYFVHEYNLDYFAAFPGCSTETEPSAATVAFLINKIKHEQIPVVFHIELSNERMADTISSETGAKKLMLHSCHNVAKRDFDAGLTYLDFMQRNSENLREALY